MTGTSDDAWGSALAEAPLWSSTRVCRRRYLSRAPGFPRATAIKLVRGSVVRRRGQDQVPAGRPSSGSRPPVSGGPPSVPLYISYESRIQEGPTV